MLQKKCYELGIGFTLHTMKCSLVTNGRNICVSDFMNSDCTHMLFLDSDIQIEAESIITMIEKNKELIFQNQNTGISKEHFYIIRKKFFVS